jgi:hypothetical protein
VTAAIERGSSVENGAAKPMAADVRLLLAAISNGLCLRREGEEDG